MFVPQWDNQVCSLGYDVADWIEAYCCHGPGDVQGEPVTLDTEWLAFLVGAYELDPRTGRRKIDRAVLSRPKGRAKSELAGMVAVAEAFAPVRFDGWNAEGQPVGRPVTSPLIKCLATEESQAGNTFENAAFIVCDFGRDTHPDVFGGASGVRQYQSATAIYLPNGGEMRATTSGAASKDGGKETFVVPDETHLYVTNELRSMYATVARNCGKRKIAEPWMLQTTTAYREGQMSVAETVLKAWREGTLPNQAHWLVDHREASGAVNLRDKGHTLRQLRQVYGSAGAWMDLERIYRTMLDPTECETPEMAARYFLNHPEPPPRTEGIVAPALWDVLNIGNADITFPVWSLEVSVGRESSTIGAAWTLAGKPHVEVVQTAPGVDWAVPRLVELADKYQAREVVIDGPSEAGSEVDRLERAGLTVHKLSGGQRAVVCGSFYDLVVGGGVTHNGDPALSAAIAWAKWKQAGEGAQVFTRRGSAGDISPLYAVALALHGALLSKPSVYEDRGAVVL